MTDFRLIRRWVWSAMETHADGTRKLIIADYSSRPFAVVVPRFLEPESLCYVEFLPSQFEAAMQDHRLTILESLHSSRPNISVMTKQMSDLGLVTGMTTHDILAQMTAATGEYLFLPED